MSKSSGLEIDQPSYRGLRHCVMEGIKGKWRKRQGVEKKGCSAYALSVAGVTTTDAGVITDGNEACTHR